MPVKPYRHPIHFHPITNENYQENYQEIFRKKGRKAPAKDQVGKSTYPGTNSRAISTSTDFAAGQAFHFEAVALASFKPGTGPDS